MATRQTKVILHVDERLSSNLGRLAAAADGLRRFFEQQGHPLDRVDMATRVSGEPQLWAGDQA